MLTGALAASVTPLRDGGAAIDEDGIGPVVDFLTAGGLDGLLALGTNGEGILLSLAERRRVTVSRSPSTVARSRQPTRSHSRSTRPRPAPTRSR